VRQLNEYRIKSEKVKEFISARREFVAAVRLVSYCLGALEFNKLAERMANRDIDEG